MLQSCRKLRETGKTSQNPEESWRQKKNDVEEDQNQITSVQNVFHLICIHSLIKLHSRFKKLSGSTSSKEHILFFWKIFEHF